MVIIKHLSPKPAKLRSLLLTGFLCYVIILFMLDLIRIIFILFLIIVFLRKKWHIGIVMAIGGILLAILYLMPPARIITASYRSLTSPVSLKLLLALSFIRSFEMILREKGLLQRITEATGSILRKRRFILISMPLLIGMLPSLGGAYFSAPMVEESSKGLDLSNEHKAYINYWFRHPWELILPLYPGIVLASAVTEIPLRSFILVNIFVAISMMIAGFFVGLRGIKGRIEPRASNPEFKKIFLPLLPVIVVIGGVAIFGIELYQILIAILIFLVILYRESLKGIIQLIRYGFSRDVLLLIAGVMLLKGMMEASGAVDGLNRYFLETGVPSAMVAFILPFVAGLLTGLTVGFVGSTFPLLLAMSGQDLPLLCLAFASGYSGVLLSPVHLCLVLTREYFKADMAGVYKKLIPGIAVMLIVSVVIFYAFKS